MSALLTFENMYAAYPMHHPPRDRARLACATRPISMDYKIPCLPGPFPSKNFLELLARLRVVFLQVKVVLPFSIRERSY
jgi:hypothetical protein